MARGSIRPVKLGSGRTVYRARYDAGLSADGRRVQGSFTRPTEAEAEAELARRLADVADGAHVLPSTATLAALLDEWLAMQAGRVRPATIHLRRHVIDRHLRATIGRLPLAKLAPYPIEDLYRRKLSEGLSARTVRGIHDCLDAALRQAVAWRLIKTNPCDAVRPPRAARYRPTLWTPAQVRAFLAESDRTPDAALWRLLFASSLRRAELLALRWRDVDLDAGELTVAETLTRDEAGRWHAGPAKTEAGQRRVTLPPSCVAALRAHRARQLARRLEAVDWHDEDRVFDRGDGTFVPPRTFNQRFQRVRIAAGLPYARPHDQRHFGATAMLAAKVPVKVVSERLGHAGPAVTLGVYAHVLEQQPKEVAELFEAILGGMAEPEEGAAESG